MDEAMRGVTRAFAVGFAVLTGAISFAAPAASDVAVFSGACTLTLEVTFNAPVTANLVSRSLSVTGGGTCVVNGQIAPLVVRGALAAPVGSGYSCAGGAAIGTGVVEIHTPGFPSPVVQLTAIETAGLVQLVLLAPVTRFDGIASMVRDVNETTSCATSGYTRTTWAGAMAFQDPYPPPV